MCCSRTRWPPQDLPFRTGVKDGWVGLWASRPLYGIGRGAGGTPAVQAASALAEAVEGHDLAGRAAPLAPGAPARRARRRARRARPSCRTDIDPAPPLLARPQRRVGEMK